jgi:hypothetical protein
MHYAEPERVLPVDLIDDLRATYGRVRIVLAVLRSPRRVPVPLPVPVPVPVDPRLRADIGLAPLPNPALVAGWVWLQVL